jgi:pimeloyl-ACP methyl ester carboxylesterase
MPILKVNDIEMYYEFHGEGSPLLMIMGWGGTIHEWSPKLIKPLQLKHKVILFENRAIGRTTLPEEEFTIKSMADDTVALLEALQIDKAHVYGISMGSAIAQEFALRYPDKLRGLILVAGGARLRPRVRSPMALEIAPLLMNPPLEMTERQIMEKFLTLLFTDQYIKNNPEEVWSMVRGYFSREPIKSRGRAMQWNAIQNSYPPIISSPTLIIHGDKDTFVPVENARILHQNIPNSKLIIYENTGHMIAEVGDQQAKDILSFLKEVDSHAQ